MYVYFIQACDPAGRIKIGYAVDPPKRLKDMQTGSASKLKLLGAIPCDSLKQARERERTLHHLFDFCRKKGEWFTSNQHLRSFPKSAAIMGFEQAWAVTFGLTRAAQIRFNRYVKGSAQ